METKPLLYAIIGFILGGLLVSVVATTQNRIQDKAAPAISTAQHNVAATNKLKKLKGDAFDKAFVVEMISHHQGAIQMAELIETHAKHDELKKLGQDIISAQTSEVSIMKAWQNDWGYSTAPQSHKTHGR